MAKVIIYQQSNGRLAVVVPTGELPLIEVARKDVPTGFPYLIMDESAIPTESSFFEAWEADFSSPDGIGIGADAWFAERASSVVEE